MLILVLAESALETIPEGLWGHPAITRYSENRGKHPNRVLLDRSYHHAAMNRLSHNHKRGRPDIVHHALLDALGSPLNKEGELQVYVHTVTNHVITVNPNTRLPKNYNRFVGLMETLFRVENVPQTGPTLLTLEREKTLSELLNTVNPTYCLAFSRQGTSSTFEEAVFRLSSEARPAVIIGGFPHGHLSEGSLRQANEVICVDPEMLEAWTVVSRVIYEYERAISLPQKRLEQRRQASPQTNLET